ncbi:MAG: glycosyltransferase [Oscillospiraceae bacterium]|nr:glycosyltransferase [Oscillospiraceae bacterium]
MSQLMPSIEWNPLVSIIIPVYNGSNYIREAINSSLEQTYENCEILVINDGSADNGETEKIALSYGDKIRYFSKPNGGVATALNTGIENMQGEYFSWLSHDDIYHPEKIEKQLSSLYETAAGEDTISICNWSQIDKNGNHVRDMNIHPHAALSMRCFLAFDADTGINGCALLIPKKLFQTHGVFNPQLKVTQDNDMWFRMASTANFVFVSDKLLSQRIHEEQGGVKQYADIALEVSDKLHAEMIETISIDEMLIFSSSNYEYLLKTFDIYKTNGYFRTAAAMLRILVLTYAQSDNRQSAIKLISDDFLNSDIESANRFLELMLSVSQKPRIVIYCHAWIGGGVERVYSTIISKLHNKYEFIILVGKYGFSPDELPFPSAAKTFFITPDDIARPLLHRATYLLSADIFIGNQNYWEEFLPIYSMFRGTKTKTIAANHMYYFLSKALPDLYSLLIKMNEWLSDASVATWSTSFSANTYSLFADNAAVMPNPNHFDEPIKTLNSSKSNVILCVARLDDQLKRADRLFRVFKLVLDEEPDAELMLRGVYNPNERMPKADDPTLEELIDELGIADNIRFVDAVECMSTYYNQAKVLVLTSEAEGFPLVLNEAAQHGVPSVIFKIPGLEDIITHGENGYIVPQDDLQAMADKLVSLLRDDALLSEMSVSAINGSERFSKDIICNRWDSLFALLLSNNRNELNKKLSQDFMIPVRDERNFSRELAHEYDGMLHIYYSEYADKVETIIEHRAEYVPEYIYIESAWKTPIKKCIRFTFRCLRRVADILKIKNALKRLKIYELLHNKGIIEKLGRGG